MNIFLREMKAYRKSLLFWSIGVIFLIASGMSKYGGLASSSESMNDLMASMPQSLQAIMGTGSLDMSKAIGYFGVLYLYLLLMTAVHAAMLGANMISKEERDKTAEFLFVKPVSRNKIISLKLLAAAVNLVIFLTIAWVTSYYMVAYYSEGESVGVDIANSMTAMFILQLLFLVIGSSIAAISKKPKKSVAIATGILLVTYIMSIAIDLNEKIEVMKYLTPFKYFEAKTVLTGEGLDVVFILLSLFLIAALTLVTFGTYKKRDLNV